MTSVGGAVQGQGLVKEAAKSQQFEQSGWCRPMGQEGLKGTLNQEWREVCGAGRQEEHVCATFFSVLGIELRAFALSYILSLFSFVF